MKITNSEVDLAFAGKSSWIPTYTGNKFDFMDFSADDIDIYDIAHGLSLTCRYGGQCDRFYSVAEHSWHMSSWLWEETSSCEITLMGLLHDASEAYMGDMIRPLKALLPDFKKMELRLEQEISKHFGLEFPFDPLIKEADNRILNDERAALFPNSSFVWNTADRIKGGLGVEIKCWSPTEAEAAFLFRFQEIRSHMR